MSITSPKFLNGPCMMTTARHLLLSAIPRTDRLADDLVRGQLTRRKVNTILFNDNDGCPVR